MAENEINTMKRRLASVTNHVAPMSISGSIGLCNCSASSSSSSSSSSMNDRYHRIHGEVPTHDPVWRLVDCDDNGKEFTDILYEKAVGEPIAKITINRQERRNAFRPHTIKELIHAFNDARDDSSVGVIILTGKGTKAFCSGGDQALRSKDGYADYENFGRLNVLDLQVGSFDAGYGSSIMSRLVGPKKAREMWFLARFYTASEAEKMGLVNAVVPLEKLEQETVKWCREILRNSPTAIRVLKSALNAVDDGHSGLQVWDVSCGKNEGLIGGATISLFNTKKQLKTGRHKLRLLLGFLRKNEGSHLEKLVNKYERGQIQRVD
ncbi:hypothetical protein TEA_028604 [Camellia sinensis var. sinensis]|uniref:C2 PI3K-type domain-containing protein n=1 Tax=Camellia sinensis var. sinensis TaxID=542762 RepID=A0A4S4DI14_CAMSN|nr:hypothetical protein TEA_028604 [Camellia sinensis var. sinensis]